MSTSKTESVIFKNILEEKIYYQTNKKIQIVQTQMNNVSLFDASNSMVDGNLIGASDAVCLLFLKSVFSADALLLVPISIKIHLLMALILLRFLLILKGCNFLHFDGSLVLLKELIQINKS